MLRQWRKNLIHQYMDILKVSTCFICRGNSHPSAILQLLCHKEYVLTLKCCMKSNNISMSSSFLSNGSFSKHSRTASRTGSDWNIENGTVKSEHIIARCYSKLEHQIWIEYLSKRTFLFVVMNTHLNRQYS